MTSTDLNMEDGNSDNIAIINEMIDKFNKINHNPVKNISINIKTGSSRTLVESNTGM
jgi:hypothetical protein